MNGSGSNTSGSKVANVGYWAKGLIEKLATGVASALGTIKRVLSGELTMAAVDFSLNTGSDLLPDVVLEEIARRLIVTLENEAVGNVVFSVAPPEDKSKVWWQLDPLTQIPIGSPKLWNATEEQWLPIAASGSAYVPPKQRKILVFAAAGTTTVNPEFADLGTSDYIVILTPTTFIEGSWAVLGTVPNAYGYAVTNKTSNSITLAFQGVPTGGLTFEVDLIERKSTV